MTLAGKAVNGKTEWVKPIKEMPHGHYVTLLKTKEVYGPFKSLEEIGKWGEGL